MAIMDKLVPVIGVEVVGDHQLRVTLGDGLVGDINFAGRHWRGVSEPCASNAFDPWKSTSLLATRQASRSSSSGSK